MAKTRNIEATKIMRDENEVVKDVHKEPQQVGMYRNYDKEFAGSGKSVGTAANSQRKPVRQTKVKREASMFKALRKLLTGPNFLPDLDQYVSGKLTKSQKKKVEKWESYFARIRNMTYYGVMNDEGDRKLRYMEYDRMEWMTPEVGRALDVLASDATIKNEEEHVLKVITENEDLKEELEYLLFDVIDIDATAFSKVRDMMKYGDSAWTNHMDTEHGLLKIMPVPVELFEREVGYDEANPIAYRYRIGAMGTDYLAPYEVTHFRLRTTVEFGEYGKSVLENGRRIWRQLITIEDSMIIYRLLRAPERRIFYFDIGNISPEDVEAAINKFSDSMKKDKIYDDDGVVDHRLAMNSVDEDIYIPVRNGQSSTKVETLPSLQWNAIDDVEYIHQKFVSSLGVPNSFLGFEEALSNKAALGNEDIRYANYVERIQAAFLAGLYDLALIHLYIKGYKTTDLKEFELHLTNPSHINELQELEALQAKLDIFSNAKEIGALPTYYLQKNVLKLSDGQIEENEKLLIRDKIFEFCLAQAEQGTVLFPKDVLDHNKAEQIAAQNAMGDEGGMGDFGGGGGFGGGEFGGDEFGGDEFGDEFSDEELSSADETDLELPNELENLEGGGDE
jgi:hypothetical protein